MCDHSAPDVCDKLQMSERTSVRREKELAKRCEVLSGQLERSEGDLKVWTCFLTRFST